MTRPNEIDPQLLSQLADLRTSRRRFMSRGAVLLGGLAISPTILAACGSSKKSDTSSTGDTGTTTEAGTADLAALQGTTMTMFNWPLYIEGDDATTSPTIKGFTDSTGVKVTYESNIDGNDTFTTKYQPDLEAGRGIGADLIVLTSWMAAQYVANGWVEQWPDGYFPNKSNVVDSQANPEWDPDRMHSIPWAMGQTGVAYWPDKCGGTLDSIDAIFDTKFKGKVTILDEMRDSVGLTMLAMGNDPTTGGLEQENAAVAKIGAARDAGQFRKITGNGYTEDLQLGDTWLCMAWSGDIASLKADNPDLADKIEFYIQTEGGMTFVDNAMIPVGAKNAPGAAAFMNYVYDPKVAGPLYEAINYVSPVKGAIDYMSPDAKDSIYINPAADSKLYEFRILPAAEDEELSRAFTAATQQ
ncbi:MAG: ABC transporter substrate-binding protein [Acidimicrobiales bacterium]